jgi:hypothetical protein
MDEQTTQAAVLKTVFLKHAYFFHAAFTPFCPANWIESSWCSSENPGFRMRAISDQLSALSKIHLKT